MTFWSVVKELFAIPHHLHRCPGYQHSPENPNHQPHVWRCFRPSCDEPPEYLCGLMADVLVSWKENGIRNMEKGRETMRKRRGC